MLKKIVQESIQQISHDTKLVRLSFFTSFFHSLTMVAIILYNINNILTSQFETWISYNTLFLYLKDKINIVVVIIIIGFIWYELIYPIGQAAIIHYLHNKQQKIGKSISKGVEKFFVMFEFNNLMLTFGVMTFFTTFLRLISLDILTNQFVLILLGIWLFCVLLASIFWPYVKYTINIDGLNLYDWIKHSTKLTINNFGLTIKFVFLEIMLLIRFVINILLILWIPLLILLITTSLDLKDNTFINFLIYGTAIILIIWTAYINGLIEAFFATYRYKAYETITAKETDLN